MAMGIISAMSFQEELNKLSDALHQESKVIQITRGRPVGGIERTPEERIDIAKAAIAGVSVEQISKEYAISPSSISAYKNGATSTASYNNNDQELKNQVEEKK